METIETLKAKIGRLPRVRLANLPTPLEPMPRLSKALGGPKLWIKRDDCTGMAFGGNKERKAEFVMADALTKKADVVVTTGSIQSNHVRVTAAAARKLGLKAVLILRGKEPKEYDGNLLLDWLFDADLKFVSANLRNVSSMMERTAKKLTKEGHVPYIIPGGASYPIGAVAYVNAMLELLEQAHDCGLEIDYIVHAAGSGGTQAGLVLASKALNSRTRILGMCVEPPDDWLKRKTVEIANDTAELLKLAVRLEPSDTTLIEDFAGEDFGVLTSEACNAIKLAAQTEGILLDPVYTGKAMAGLIGMVKENRFREDDSVVFIHTGGTPALFPYRKELLRRAS